MPKFYVEIWASVCSTHDRQIVEVEQDEEPTEEEMEQIYQDFVCNILDSGYGLVTKEDYEDYLENG